MLSSTFSKSNKSTNNALFQEDTFVRNKLNNNEQV